MYLRNMSLNETTFFSIFNSIQSGKKLEFAFKFRLYRLSSEIATEKYYNNLKTIMMMLTFTLKLSRTIHQRLLMVVTVNFSNDLWWKSNVLCLSICCENSLKISISSNGKCHFRNLNLRVTRKVPLTKFIPLKLNLAWQSHGVQE